MSQTLQTALSLPPVSEVDLEAEIASLASALAANPNDSAIQHQYDTTLAQSFIFHRSTCHNSRTVRACTTFLSIPPSSI